MTSFRCGCSFEMKKKILPGHAMRKWMSFRFRRRSRRFLRCHL
jgi:hypothetical protein